jgi:uncharacterized membrane protein
MKIDTISLLAILAMALVTYATRAAGPWLVARLPPSPRLQSGLRHLPGAILAALVAPAALAAGPPGIAAGLVVMLLVAHTGRVLPAVLLGVALVVAARALTPGT